jgi:alpha-mannosidase
MIGNAHIDPVWLWSWQAGVDEALASFRSAADRCEEYPEFIYTRGEAWLYEQVEKIDPVLFARVRRLIKRGQWHVTGGQYVQPDANLPSLLGWQKQLARGSSYFKKQFGVRSRVGYNVDTFGHPAALPDILAAQGFDAYVFHRPTHKQMTLPGTFRWRGVGGAEVLAFRIAPAYTCRTDDLYGQIMLTLDYADRKLGHAMCFYGVGNHGGGPTKGNIEYILKNRLAFDGVELRFSTPEFFFDEIRKRRAQLPVIDTELQRIFPGCYSVMHDIKQAQRHGEHLLGQCGEAIRQWSFGKKEKDERLARLDRAWDDLLFTQFHDILAGTSFPSAWQGVRDMQGRARLAAEEILTETTRRWARRKLPKINHQQIALFNAGADDWDDVVECEPFLDFQRWGDRWLSDEAGNPIEFQMIQPEAAVPFSLRTVFRTRIPARSAKIVLVRDDPRSAPAVAKGTDLEVSPTGMKNSQLSIELGPTGITSLQVAGQQLLDKKGISLLLRKDGTDTWTFHTDQFTEKITQTLAGADWKVEEAGPVRARVHSESRLGDSVVKWTLGLMSHDPRLVMDLEIDFRETYRLLQMPMHLRDVLPQRTDGLAGGHVRREQAATEWPVVGWSRVRCGKLDVGLVTQDAYSLSQNENVWQWTMLRSPKMAWGGTDPCIFTGRTHHTDQGTHRFRFVLHFGRRLAPETLEKYARQAAEHPILFDRYEGMNRPAWGNNPPRYLWTGAEERAQQDGRLTELSPADVKGIEEPPAKIDLREKQAVRHPRKSR